MPSSSTVAIVILNWNGRSYLEQFLPSVMQHAGEARVIVADNHSTDDSIEFLQSRFPSVEIIRLQENHGFARGYNLALKEVKADYYMLLNSDVEVTAGWLDPLVALLDQHKEIAACQPAILSFHQKDYFEYAGAAGGWIDQYGYPFSRGRLFDNCEKNEGQYHEAPVFWASGAALLIRSEVFHGLHGFDDHFFAHMEEIDLCWRIQLSGWMVYACPTATVYHVGGGTLPKGNSRKTYLNFRNNLLMMAKNLPWQEKLWKMPFRLLLDQVAGVKALLGGDAGYWKAVTRAQWDGLGWWIRGKIKTTKGRRPLHSLKGVYRGSIVWAHFVRGKKTFRSLVKES